MKVTANKQGFSFALDNLDAGLLEPYAELFMDDQAIKTGGDLVFAGQNRVQTFFGPGVRREYRRDDERGFILRWMVTELEKTNAVLMDAVLENQSGQDIYFKQAALSSSGSAIRCGGSPQDWMLSSMIGDFYGTDLEEVCPSANERENAMWEGFHMEVPRELPTDEQHTDGRWRMFDEYLTLYTDKGCSGLFFSPAGDPVAFLRYECYVDKGAVRLNLICDMSNVLVRPGQSRAIQQFIIAAEPLGEIVPRVMQNIAVTHGCRNVHRPFCGWCSWYDLAREITEESVMQSVQAFVDNKDKIKMDFIQIDDGYQVVPGDWLANEKFPHGLAPIVEKINETGAMPGVWVAPLLVHETTDVFREHPDWFARDDEGQLTGKMGNWGGSVYVLDSSNPEAREFIQDLIRQKYKDGFRYFKFDFCNVYMNGKTSYDPTKTSLEAFRELFEIYRRTIGEECYMESAFNRGILGYADSSRTGTDSCDNWDDSACCIKNAMRQNAVKSYANGVLLACDPDVTYMKTDGITEDERRMWHSFVGLFGGVQQVSDPMAQRQEELRQLEILVPPAKEKAHPVNPGTDRENTRVGFLAYRPYGEFGCYMIWNPLDHAAVMQTELEELSAIGAGDYHVFSFWDGQYMGVQGCDFTLPELPAHGVMLLRFTPVGKEGVPTLIGSDLHISMGAAEVEDVAVWDGGMEIILNTAGALDGSLYIYSARPFQSCTAQGCDSAVMTRQDSVTRVELRGRSRQNRQKISLR